MKDIILNFDIEPITRSNREHGITDDNPIILIIDKQSNEVNEEELTTLLQNGHSST